MRTSRRKQSPADRRIRLIRRIIQGLCPVHGTGMRMAEHLPSSFAGCDNEEDEDGPYEIRVCTRAGCRIYAKVFSSSGRWKFMPKFLYRLQEGTEAEAP